MRITLLFGGTNKERLVSVATAQALHRALPEADLWFWHVNDTVHEVRSETLLDHKRPSKLVMTAHIEAFLRLNLISKLRRRLPDMRSVRERSAQEW